ncbi:MAG: carbohydrate kinase family protein [Oscillospiraceae bacterium]|nr:carbohydrate kinase family protein [Oscillospiraceae bacterium]
MSNISICGLVNMEVTVGIDSFPFEYRPIDYRFFGVASNPGGVGYNLSLAFKALGDEVNLMSFCADDPAGRLIKAELEAKGVSTDNILTENKATAQSVVLYDKEGKRSILCDLTDNQELSYPEDKFIASTENADIICLCNINYAASRIEDAKKTGALVATDVHCLSDINDEYNSRFMKAADIVFLSNEAIMGREAEFSADIMRKYNNKIVIVGMGKEGALLRTTPGEEPQHIPSVYTRPVVNTVGAGDSLFAAFLHFYAKTRDAEKSLVKAAYFASYKIGENGAAKGFLSEEKLLELIN